jgi:CRISPR-associated protein Csd2
MTALANRYDIVFLFDVTNGNPNGDPDAGNMPRMDPETNKGLVSDVSLKRKIRNYTELTKGDQPGYRIYVQEGSILNEKHREAYKAVRGDTEKVKKDSKLNPQTDDESRALTKFMCDNFFDVRAFGAVMGLGINAGQVRGPVQVTFASSIETILPLEISITRMAVANERKRLNASKATTEISGPRTAPWAASTLCPMASIAPTSSSTPSWQSELASGRPISPSCSKVWVRCSNMTDRQRGGEMSSRRGIAFKHASALGNAHAHALFERVQVHRKIGDELFEPGSDRLSNYPPARRFSDYEVTVNRDGLPESVEVVELF